MQDLGALHNSPYDMIPCALPRCMAQTHLDTASPLPGRPLRGSMHTLQHLWNSTRPPAARILDLHVRARVCVCVGGEILEHHTQGASCGQCSQTDSIACIDAWMHAGKSKSNKSRALITGGVGVEPPSLRVPPPTSPRASRACGLVSGAKLLHDDTAQLCYRLCDMRS